MTWSEADLELLCSQIDDSIRSQKEENVELVNKLVVLTETVREVESYNRVLKRHLTSCHSDKPKKLQKEGIPDSKLIKQEPKQKNNHSIASKSQISSDDPLKSVQSTTPIRVTVTPNIQRQEKLLNSTSSLLRPPIISTNNPPTNRIQIQHLKPGQQIRLSHPNPSTSSSSSTSTIRISNPHQINSSTSAPCSSSVPIILSPKCSSSSINASSAPGVNIRTALTPRVSSGGSVITVTARAPGQSNSNPTVLHIQKSVPVKSISPIKNANPSQSVASSIPVSAASIQKSADETAAKDKTVITVNPAPPKPAMSNAFKNFAKSIGTKIAAEYGGAIDQAKMAAELMQRWKKLTEDERRKYI